MKATFIGMLVVLAVSLGLCFLSLYYQHDSLQEMDRLRMQAIEHLEARDGDAAQEKLVELANVFKKKAKIIELLASHNDLHEAYLQIVTSQISLETGDMDDAYQALALLGEVLEHLQQHEAFSLENLY